MHMLLRLLMVLALFAPLNALAVEPSEILADPKLETRARALSANLRCLVCQNQSIDDSNAPLAKDLRVLVRERLKAGDSDRQVMDYLVARYGDFILLSPPLKPGTIMLWVAPFAVLILGAGFILWTVRRRKMADHIAAPLSDDEVAKLSAILDKKSP
jgi:cytochrome c-type biogenesis protein CcmH